MLRGTEAPAPIYADGHLLEKEEPMRRGPGSLLICSLESGGREVLCSGTPARAQTTSFPGVCTCGPGDAGRQMGPCLHGHSGGEQEAWHQGQGC